MDLFEYDYDDLAGQIQQGLERVAISFLRAHGARISRDQADFHGKEYLELELRHEAHSLKVRQVRAAPPPGTDLSIANPAPLEEFESSFDSWPAANAPKGTIATWLRSLPAGQAQAERPAARPEPSNPFLADRPTSRAPGGSAANPFLGERPVEQPPRNPFAADSDRERQRQEMLRRLREDE